MTALEMFREKNGLSYRKLANLFGGAQGGANETAVKLLCKGTADARLVERVQFNVLAGLQKFTTPNRAQKIWAETCSALKSERNLTDMLHRQVLDPQVVAHFGMNHDPFELEVLDNEIFPSNDFRAPHLEALFNEAVRTISRKGISCYLGEAGSGKSTLQQRLLTYADKPANKTRIFKIVGFESNKISWGAITRQVIEELGHRPPVQSAGRDRKFAKLMTELADQGLHVAVMIDDCHALDGSLLYTLKKAHEDVQKFGRRLVSFLLFGQPRFADQLLDVRYTEINQRIKRIGMPPVSTYGREYIAFRLQLAGGDLEGLFDTAAVVRLLDSYTTPLALGNGANASLLNAFNKGQKKVSADLVVIPNQPLSRSSRNPVLKSA